MCVCTRVCVCVYPPPPPTTGYTHPHPHTRVHTHTHTYPPPGVGARTASIRDAPCKRRGPHRIDPRRARTASITRPTHRARAPTALHTAAGPDSPPLQAQRRPLQRRSCGRPHRPKNRLRTYKLDHKRLICALLELPLKRQRAASDTRRDGRTQTTGPYRRNLRLELPFFKFF